MTSETYTIRYLKQGSDEWQDWRCERWMASEAAVIMGAAPSWSHIRTWDDLRMEKAGLGEEPSDWAKLNFERGHAGEAVAFTAFQGWIEVEGRLCAKGTCIEDKQDTRKAASLDGYVFGPDGAVGWVEIKTPVHNATWWLKLVDGDFSTLPDHYQWQLVHQWQVLGGSDDLRCWFVVNDGADADNLDRIHRFDFKPDATWHSMAAALWAEWERWETHGDNDDLPEGWRAGASAFKIAEELLAEATQRYDEAKALLVEMSAGKTISGFGVEVKHGSRAGPLDPDIITRTLPDADMFRTPGPFNAILLKKAGHNPDEFRKPRIKTVTVKVT